MLESEIWVTRLFNDYLAGAANAALKLAGLQAQARPWTNSMAMQIFVAALLMLVFAVLRLRLSVDKPGKLQHVFELVYEFVLGQAEDQVGHVAHKYLAFFGTIFLFILACNLIGIIPCFSCPTKDYAVTCGCALATFAYYHWNGILENGWRYPLQFMGPMWWLAWLMFPIEIISHLARVLSLTVRLYANMFAGEQVTIVFLGLVPLAVPVIFMGLHVFVSVIQAYIFMLLAMAYVGGAIAHEH
ncbi:MAG TPA: F0F1 ATP synthase subunit A [Bryobacteraceae bacterium]|nr:F0F1 ATP synthase subunit A [Bryobacteraceae bacterium]